MSPGTATFSKAVPASVVLTVSPVDGAVLSQIKVDGATITKTGNYTTSGNTVTLLSAYLTILTNAVHAVELVMSVGDNPSVTVTVTA